MTIANTSYRLSIEQISSFNKNGHILLKGLATQDELDFFRPKIKNACKRLNKETRALEDRDTYNKAFLQTMNLWTQDPVVKSFVNPILN